MKKRLPSPEHADTLSLDALRRLVSGLVEKAEHAETRLAKLETENAALREENARLDQALSWTADGLTALGQGAIEVTSSFADRMGQRYEQARDWAGEKLEQAGEGLQDAGRWTKERVSEAADWTVEKAEEVRDWASQTADDIGEWTADRATEAGNWADRQARDALRKRAGDAWEGAF